jgi:hypothetical protein
LLTTGSIAPAAAALIAAVAVATLPRIGWTCLIAGVAVLAVAQGRPGGAILLVLAAATPILLLPRAGTIWPLSVGAPALGLIALAGAWPALAGRVGGPWRRAVTGTSGWLALVLMSPLHGSGLYASLPAGVAHPAAYLGSLQQTAELILRPIISSGLLAGAPVWAAAAIVLPWLTAQPRFPVRIVLVVTWAAVTVSATQAALTLGHASTGVLIDSGSATGGAVLAAILALAPGAIDAVRVGRADVQLP